MVDANQLWYGITLIGAPEMWVLGIIGVFWVLFYLRRYEKGGHERLKDFLILIIPVMILTFLLAVSFKSYIDVPRGCVPCVTEISGCNPYCPVDSSFPSGHAATAFAGFSAVWLILGAKRKALIIYAIPFMVAVSRIMLGVHAWLDVFAGAVLGMAVAFLVWETDKRLKR